MFPTREEQNAFGDRYFTPIIHEGIVDGLKTIYFNIRDSAATKKAKEKTELRAEMQAAGVFDSLGRLASEGTSWEREIAPTLTRVRTNIPGTIEYQAVAIVEELFDKLNIRRSNYLTNLNYSPARKQRRLNYASARTHLSRPNNMENAKRK